MWSFFLVWTDGSQGHRATEPVVTTIGLSRPRRLGGASDLLPLPPRIAIGLEGVLGRSEALPALNDLDALRARPSGLAGLAQYQVSRRGFCDMGFAPGTAPPVPDVCRSLQVVPRSWTGVAPSHETRPMAVRLLGVCHVTSAQRRRQHFVRAIPLRIIVQQTATKGRRRAAPRSTLPRQSCAAAMRYLGFVPPSAAASSASPRPRSEDARAPVCGALLGRSTRSGPGAPRHNDHGHRGRLNASPALRDRYRAN